MMRMGMTRHVVFGCVARFILPLSNRDSRQSALISVIKRSSRLPQSGHLVGNDRAPVTMANRWLSLIIVVGRTAQGRSLLPSSVSVPNPSIDRLRRRPAPELFPSAWVFAIEPPMPTVLRIGGLRVVIYPNDHRPAHVHVKGADGEAVFILHCPAGPPELRESYGFRLAVLSDIQDALHAALSMLCAEWSAIHGDY